MEKYKKISYIIIRFFRFLAAMILFSAYSSFYQILLKFSVNNIRYDVNILLIDILGVLVGLFAFFYVLCLFIRTDKSAREKYFESGRLPNIDILISFVLFSLNFFVYDEPYVIENIYRVLDISRLWCMLISYVSFLIVFVASWFFGIKKWRVIHHRVTQKNEKPKDVRTVIFESIGIFFAFSFVCYVVPVLVPATMSFPKVLFVFISAILPFAIVVYLALNLFSVFRCLLIRIRFLNKLKKAAKKHRYTVSEIKHPILSLFCEFDGNSFTLLANEKTYCCKLIAARSYGSPMHFYEKGIGKIIKHIRFRAFLYGRRGLGRIGWYNTDDLATVETTFHYGFEGEGKKVLIVNPTPHTIYATAFDKNKLLDVGDNVWGYTLMTGTAFINALERDTI